MQVLNLLSSLRRSEAGQGLAEYALILALIAVVVIAAVTFLGTPDQPDHVHDRRQDLRRGRTGAVRADGNASS